MARALALDMSRLWLASLRPTPRGIERGDLALIRELLDAWPGDLFGLTPTPWGLSIVGREGVSRLIGRVGDVWREEASPESDPVYRQIRDWLNGRDEFRPAVPEPSWRHQILKARRGLGALRATGISLGQRPTRLPEGAIVASFGHVGLLSPGFAKLLAHRRDLKVVAMLHDVISLTDPQFFPKRNEGYFRSVLDRAFSHDTLIVTTTDYVRGQIEEFASEAGVSVTVRAIDHDGASSHVPAPDCDPQLAGAPYFILCGTREPRKNHMLILNVWRAMAAAGETPPKLILAGGHGWGAELIDGMLARSQYLRGHVAHAETLGSPGLLKLMGQSRALLSPSFAEGYGLPVVEALVGGTPVIASRIGAYLETTVGCATLLDPLDGPAWRREIAAHASAPPPSNASRKTLIARFAEKRVRHPGIVQRLAEL
jgi:glycosyltransferase involved in cell wall biosynthesis